jgi:hypothetical protein
LFSNKKIFITVTHTPCTDADDLYNNIYSCSFIYILCIICITFYHVIGLYKPYPVDEFVPIKEFEFEKKKEKKKLHIIKKEGFYLCCKSNTTPPLMHRD